MKVGICHAALLLLLLFTATACAGPSAEQPQASPVVETATPAEQQLAWILQALDREGPALTEQEVRQHVSEHFAEVVPPAQYIEGLDQVSSRWPGLELTSFEGEQTDFRLVAILRAENGDYLRLGVQTEEQPPYRLVGSRIQLATDLAEGIPHPRNWEELDQAIQAEASSVSLLAAELVDGECHLVHAIDPERSLAIGSAFKLYVLLALAREIEAGRRSWDEMLAIRDEWISLPSGRMQQEEAGSEFTIRYYAEQMISISDNTAADHLLFHVGRDSVEQAMVASGHHDPDTNRPFLTTREMFALKLLSDTATLEHYLGLDVEQRREYLDTVVAEMNLAPALFASAFWSMPYRIEEIEWYGSAGDICQVLSALKSAAEQEGGEPVFDILSINPGLPFDPVHWPYIGYKGGSEPGVLNLSWLLRRDDDRWFILTSSLNDTRHTLDMEPISYYLQVASQLLYEAP